MSGQTVSVIRDLLERHGLRPRQSLGQHFLADPALIKRVVAEAGVSPGDQVVEVGAGTGALTAALARAGARVVAYEVDQRLRPVLEETLDGLDVDLRFEDAAEADWSGTFADGAWKLVANLPYQVGTGIVLDVLQEADGIELIVAMVQLEVADRLVAEPGDEAYGLPSVIVRLHSDPRLSFKVRPQVFYPPPTVQSAVVKLVRHPAPEGAARAVALAAAGFGQRRKMLRGSLRTILPDPASVLAAAGIDPTARAEELSAADYLRLAEFSP
jgi:16S rRNA (adenine1518-N6/adenine1519-N6)-dimethyltransferase